MIHSSKHYVAEPEGAAAQSRGVDKRELPEKGTWTLKAEKMPAR